jgi:hypothetical protein
MNPKHSHLGSWNSKMFRIFGFRVKLTNEVQFGFSIYHCKGFEAQISKVNSHIQFQVVS